MDFDLDLRTKKLNKEQSKRKIEAKERIERQRKIEEEVQRKQRDLEEKARERHRELLKQAEEEESRRLEEERVTGGIAYKSELIAYPTTHAEDRVILPSSALECLNPQNALDIGPLTFELTTHEGNQVTHSGVLEFNAEEGYIGIPPKIARCLVGNLPYSSLNKINIRYVRLCKASFIQFQPCGKGFENREINMKELFERTLKNHVTLTVGDLVLVRQGQTAFEVAVKKILPEPQCLILNCDVEVDILPSEELMRNVLDHIVVPIQSDNETNTSILSEEKEREDVKRQKLENFIPEYPLDGLNCVKTLIRLQDGSQSSRRFSHSSLLSYLFEYVAILTGDETESFRILTNFPRRIFTAEQGSLSFLELGLTDRQELFFVEKIVTTDDQQHIKGIDHPVSLDSKPSQVSVVLQNQKENTSNENNGETMPNTWEDARACLEKRIDQELQNNGKVQVHALEPIFPDASSTGDKWSAQLSELEKMGFMDKETNVRLLERYQGRLLRVINYLSEMH